MVLGWCWATVVGVNRRHAIALIGSTAAAVIGIPLAWSVYGLLRFPSDRTPEGVYLRIVIAMNNGDDAKVFPYLEQEAQNAVCTIHEYRAKSLKLVRASFEEPERSKWEAAYIEEGDAAGPAALWTVLASRHGWGSRLRADLSGIASVERVGPRASVVTIRGTRYPFRQASAGFWGLALFTAELVAQKDRAPRDYVFVEQAAADYERAKK